VAEKWVPEGSLPSIRDGRLAIPVSAEHKRKLRGFILDESATGQTVFIEPVEILESNNEIRELEYAEKREVIRILKELTNSLRIELHILEPAFEFLAQVDFIRAKAKLSREIEADLPMLSDHPELVWYNAKHPLLYLSLKGKRDVIPLTVELSPENPMLLVSGPNAGGKSVCLKTIGLLQYMVQCGLLIPVSDRSRVGIFNRIFLDIGDQQSIENDLSTYSSHLKNMNVFVREATERSLVLMDELGSGTDPNFGGAIAQAILHGLLKKKVWGVATTHYYNLKLFAGQQPGIRNAAMRFDEEKMAPKFMLDIGKPGSSFALEIAKKTGLPEESLAEAEELVGKDLAGFEKLIRTLEKEREDLHVRLVEMGKNEHRMQQSLARYESLSTELEAKKKEIINKAKDEAANLLRQTNREIEKTIRHIRENKAEKKETTRVRNTLKNLAQEVTKDKDHQTIKVEDIKPGDRVRIIGQESSGIVLQVQGKNASVSFGELKSYVSLSKLEKISGKQERQVNKKLQSMGMNVLDKRISFSPSLDIRGKRVEEVIPILDPFLDTAILLGHSQLKILHGKGEGVLRKVVREHLKRYKEVASVSDEHVDRGGDGITLVVLK
jgi:DNA mismatch repair protein MutS2